VIELYKLKYYNLKKEEKYIIKDKFYQTEFGKETKNRLNRLLLTGILGILFSIYLFLFQKNVWEIIIGIILIITSTIFIIGSYKIRIKKINDYLVKNSKSK